MARTQIMVSLKDLMKFSEMLSNSASKYKSGYDRLSNLIDEVTKTGVRGDAAVRLRQLYDQKKPTFDNIYKEVNKAQGYAEHQINEFKTTSRNIDSSLM